MIQDTTFAYSELTRVLPWSFRALGYKFGTADRAAHLVATAAAMNPALLDEMVHVRMRPAGSPTLTRAPGFLTMDAHGISLLELGPVAVDYLAAHVDDAELNTCIITAVTEVSLIPAVLIAAGTYDMRCVALVTGRGKPTWHYVGHDGGSTVLVSGTSLESLDALMPDQYNIRSKLPPLDDPAGTVVLIAGDAVPLITPPAEAIRPAELISLAHRRGIPVSQATLDALYGLEMLTWAPTSERSRAQAGFTAPSVSAQ